MTASTHSTSRPRSWPRRRLQLRSVISSVLPIGWAWAAATALVPYFWAGRGPGTSATTIAGLSRATWIDLHVWSSIAMGLLTIGHVVLNRKGMARSYRVLGGTSANAAGRIPAAEADAPERGYTWAPALAVAAIVIAGGFWFAAAGDDHHGDGPATAFDDAEDETGATTRIDEGRALDGSGHRGGRLGG